MLPKLLLLTGSKGSGKDAFAEIMTRLYPGRARSLALADWFKKLLADATGFDPASFYDNRKEAPYRLPLKLDGRLQCRLQQELVDQYHSWFGGDVMEEATTTWLRHYQSREFTSNRKLMEFFGFEFIHDLLKDDKIHCEILLKRANTLLMGDPHCQYLIVTDARTYFESHYLYEVWKRQNGQAYRIRILGPHESGIADQGIESAVEKAVRTGWPAKWFDAVLDNSERNLTSRDSFQYNIKVELEDLFERTDRRT